MLGYDIRIQGAMVGFNLFQKVSIDTDLAAIENEMK